jgi:PAS domain S-box-containing protein
MDFWDVVHPSDRESARERAERRLRGEPVPLQFEQPIVRKDGAERLLDFSVTRFAYDGQPAALGVFIDITERKLAEAAARLANERFGSVLRAATGYSILVTDANGVITVMNEGAEQMLGYRSEELIGKADLARLHAPDELAARGQELGLASGYEVLVQTPRLGESETREWTYLRKDGRRLSVLLTVAPIRGEAGALDGFIAIARDITAQKKLEQQLIQSQKMETVGLLAGGVAHDFNNLLVPILGYSELMMLEPSIDASTRTQIQQIQYSAQRARELTQRLLAFSRKQVIELKVVVLEDVVRRFESVLRRTIRENVCIKVVVSSKLSPVRADTGQIEQILLNLAINAQDAMPLGGILTIEVADVELDESYSARHPEALPGSYVMLAVSDNGNGMDEATVLRIFEPFFTTKEIGRGTGLGLSTVYGIVKQHGGSISVYSELSWGSTFKIFLPRAVGAELAANVNQSTAELPQGGETILVVEDDEVVRMAVCKMIENLGYRIVAANAESALQFARTSKTPVHLLLTDVVMPGMNGQELYQAIARERPGLKVLYVSGYSTTVIGHHGVLDEGVSFLQKPFTLSVLSQKIRQTLDS